jgi:hypothetical protein
MDKPAERTNGFRPGVWNFYRVAGKKVAVADEKDGKLAFSNS